MAPFLLHHLLASCTTETDLPILIDGDKVLSRGEFNSRVHQVAKGLVLAGVGGGERVAVLLPKSFDEGISIFAASLAGGVFVPINSILVDEQVEHIVTDCAAKIVITTEQRAEHLKPRLDAEVVTVEALISAGIQSDCALPTGGIGEDLAAILYTSGSTGRPKGVMLSHRNLIAGTRIVRTYLGITNQDRLLSVLPFSFDYGLNQLLTVVEQGASLVLFEFRFGDEIVRCLKRHEITGFAGVPAIWAILTKAAPSLKKTELPHLRYITNSGGAVPSATVDLLQERLPTTDVYLMYGLTEAFRSTFLPPEELKTRPTSIGKAIPECEVFPVTKDGRRAKPGEPGILVHRGPTVSLGYWNRPEDTAAVIRPHPFRSSELGGEFVCYSGDLVTEDEDGFLYFVARDDAMIKSAGFRISPTEVEEVLMSTRRFTHVAVIGLADDWIGQRVHAVAVASDGPHCSKQVLSEVAAHLPAHMVPKQIEFVDTLPTTANGKIDYKKLVAERK